MSPKDDMSFVHCFCHYSRLQLTAAEKLLSSPRTFSTIYGAVAVVPGQDDPRTLLVKHASYQPEFFNQLRDNAYFKLHVSL